MYKQFTPSKTATNGLNFFTKEEESNIKTKSQPIQIINIFKTIYIMFNESFDHLEDNDIIPNIFNHILPHLKCDSFSKPIYIYIYISSPKLNRAILA